MVKVTGFGMQLKGNSSSDRPHYGKIYMILFANRYYRNEFFTRDEATVKTPNVV